MAENKRYIDLFFVILVLGLICVSCSEHAEITPTKTDMPTQPPPTVTATLPPPITPTATLPFQVDSTCWPIKPIQEADYLTGGFLYEEPFNEPFVTPELRNTSLFAFDVGLQKTERVDLNNRIQAAVFFSPDSKKLAYEQDAKIFIVNQKGVRAYTLPDNKFLIDAYLKDGRIRLEHLWDNRNNYEQGKGLALTYYIFDPITGITQKNTVFLPNYYENGPGDRTLHYSPDMKYVLYRSSAYGTKAEFTLFDLEKNKVIWVDPPRDKNLVFLADAKPDWLHIINYRDTFLLNIGVVDPVWLPNTDMLATLFLDNFTGQTKYYSISREGDISPITNFDMRNLIDGEWPQPELTFSVMSPAWSPNRRYLISAGKEKEEGNSIYIWDSQEDVVYKPCLPDETKTIIPPSVEQYLDDSKLIVGLTFDIGQFPRMTRVPEKSFLGRGSIIYFLDLSKKIIYEIPSFISVRSFINENNSTLKALLVGWVNWEIP